MYIQENKTYPIVKTHPYNNKCTHCNNQDDTFYNLGACLDCSTDHIISLLPHGSGIDCKWTYERKIDRLVFYNSFHCMDENGFYDGYADFSVMLPFRDILDFKLRFHGKESQYKNQKYMLRGYLEESIYFYLVDNLEKTNSATKG